MSLDLAEIIYRLEVIVISLLVLALVVAGLFGLWLLFVLWLRFRDREERSLETVLLQVAVPRDNEVKIDSMEQLFSSLASLHQGGGWFSFFTPQPHISFEIVALPEDIRFYVAVPEKYRDLVEKQIHGAYFGADIIEVEEYSIFSEQGQMAFASFKLSDKDYLPIRVFRDLPIDPLASITSVMAKMHQGEGAVFQLIISPSGGKWKKEGGGYISQIKKQEADPEKAQYDTDPKKLEAIGTKVGKAGFNTVIRVVVSSTSTEMANMHLSNIETALSPLNSDNNSFTRSKHFIKRLFMVDFIYRYFPILNFPYKQTSVLSSDELATVFHFPNKSIETPHIFWLNAKRAPAPALIPTSGLFIGNSKFRGVSRPIYMQKRDRQRHMYIIGKTGVGKSEFLINMLLQDIRNGEGVCFIDPHDTVEKLLPFIPPERAEDVIYFNPADTERPMGLNMLEAKTEDQKHFVSSAIIGLMYKLFDPMKTGIIGPRFEHAVRNAMLTVMYEEGATMIEVVRILQDPKYVQAILPKVKDPIIKRYWTDQIAQTSDFHKSEVLDYIVSKFGRFVTNKMMRNIIGQSVSAFDFRKVMDEKKILLVNLAKGRLGEENSNFLGLILVPRLLMAAMSRQDVPEDQRPDFYLYVDEFQNFATPDFAQILSEARKYHLNLTVANQFIGQMDDEVKNAIFGNVGTLAAFRVGVTDANYLQHEFQPTFNEGDLINIDKYNTYFRTTVNNEPMVPFSVDMTRDVEGERKLANPKVGEAIVQLSRLKYGKSSELVEAEIGQPARL